MWFPENLIETPYLLCFQIFNESERAAVKIRHNPSSQNHRSRYPRYVLQTTWSQLLRQLHLSRWCRPCESSFNSPHRSQYVPQHNPTRKISRRVGRPPSSTFRGEIEKGIGRKWSQSRREGPVNEWRGLLWCQSWCSSILSWLLRVWLVYSYFVHFMHTISNRYTAQVLVLYSITGLRQFVSIISRTSRMDWVSLLLVKSREAS